MKKELGDNLEEGLNNLVLIRGQAFLSAIIETQRKQRLVYNFQKRIYEDSGKKSAEEYENARR